jgi:hypothetical protein
MKYESETENSTRKNENRAPFAMRPMRKGNKIAETKTTL